MARLFAGRALVSLLMVFFLHPARDFYQRELVALIGQRLFVVQTALKRLAAAGVVDRLSRGNRTYYRVNSMHPAFEELRSLVVKTIGLGDSLRAKLATLGSKVKVAFLYGSVARGGESASSDVDVMLIGDASSREVASVLAPAKRRLNREINPVVYRPVELKRKLRSRHPFIVEVMEQPKIFLLGDERALKGIIGRG